MRRKRNRGGCAFADEEMDAIGERMTDATVLGIDGGRDGIRGTAGPREMARMEEKGEAGKTRCKRRPKANKDEKKRRDTESRRSWHMYLEARNKLARYLHGSPVRLVPTW